MGSAFKSGAGKGGLFGQMLKKSEEEAEKNAEKNDEKNAEKNSSKDSKTLQGIHSYDILANPRYYSAFNYVPVAQDEGDERHEFIIDDDDDVTNNEWQSDKVLVLLNMAFM